jgi:spoIIIJ-associated protein
VSGPELGLLIGKHGQTIDSLQFLCSQAAFRGKEQRKRVVLDAGGYRKRRESMLHRQADRAVADALRYGRAIELDSMSASERKVVHLYLQDHVDVETHSEGDEPFRRIVITPIRPR